MTQYTVKRRILLSVKTTNYWLQKKPNYYKKILAKK